MLPAFRLFGNFHWPPVGGRPKEIPDDTQAGVIEIFYLPKPGSPADTKTALLRWVPGRVQEEADKPDPTELTLIPLFDLTHKEAVAWFEKRKTTGGMIWLDGKPKDPKLAPDISFRGAFLLQQFSVDGRDPLQWPLVSEVSYVSTSKTHSALAVYWLKNLATQQLALRLNLPLPVMRRVKIQEDKDSKSVVAKSTVTYTDVPAFPFSVVYDVTTIEGPLEVTPTTLVSGWIEKEGTVKVPELQSDNLPGFSEVESRRLGAFGFSVAEESGDGFVSAAGSAVPLSRLWPGNLKIAAWQILERYGFHITGNDVGAKPDDLEPSNLSIRFAPNKLIYRIHVPSKFKDGSDLTSAIIGSGAAAITVMQLRLRPELEGPVADQVHYAPGAAPRLGVGKELLIDCELAWSIDEKNIWPPEKPAEGLDDGRNWTIETNVRLLWKESSGSISAMGAKALKPMRGGLLGVANQTFVTTRAAFIAGEAGLPHSFLPTIEADGEQDDVIFCLYGPPVRGAFSKDGLVSWGSDLDPDGWVRPQMRLTLADADVLIPGLETETEFEVILTNISFFKQTGVTIKAALKHDPDWLPDSEGDIEGDQNFFASYKLRLNKIEAGKDVETWSGRLGSLEFAGDACTIIADPSLKDGDSYLRIGREGTGRTGRNGALVYPRGAAAVELRLPIPATSVEQVAVDVARGDRSGRPGPLLIPLNGPSATAANKAEGEARASYWLIATESLAPRDDRLLRAEIFDLSQSEDGTSKSFVVLSEQPFSLFKFTQSALGARGDAKTASVATYSGDTRMWQYKVVTQHYHYVLPPQAVGESADKPRRLEIHDLPDRSGEVPPRPYVSARYDIDTKDTPDDLRRRAVEFRLTPSAEIWISPSDVERGYFVPESASYEIFRQRGEYGLGAQLSYLRAEFLYGMPVGLDVAKETGISRGARVAEIEALTGMLPGRGGDSAANDHTNRWNSVRAAFARRPERLEVWARDLDSTTAFTPARFRDGVSFVLRGTALHRHPIGPDGEVELVPLVGGGEAGDAKALLPRHHPQGLSGGAIWPVESNNLFNVLIQTPASKGGAIERIALSPFGGDAAQKAEFLDGKVTIISETYNGHVQRQQVEVLGRICAFWHRAKHVVVYERTVNATAQFAPFKEEDPNRTRSRRPVLRKVSEYIELMQPERDYPDFTNAEQRSSGFLEKVRFNSRIINVDSAWSTDVGDFGWKIPLWNRLSARQRPQVYPMPDIAFVSTAEGDGERPVVSQECLDPDRLFFFADFKATTPDTNLWESRLGLDFPNMPGAKKLADVADTASAKPIPNGDEYADGRRRSVSRFLPGLRPFTWRLAPAAQKAALNAGRSAKPVFVDLDSVTFMRASHTDKDLRKDLGDVLTDRVNYDRNSDAARRLAKVPYWDKDGNGFEANDLTLVDAKAAFKKYAGHDGALATAINDGDLATVKTLIGNVISKTALGEFKQGLTDHLKGLVQPEDLKKFANFKSALSEGGAFCDKLKHDTVGMVQRKEMLLRTAVADVVGDAEHILAKLPITKEEIKDDLLKSVVDQIRPILADASTDIGNLDAGVEAARAIVLELDIEIQLVFERARQRMEQFIAGYDQTKPWSEARRQAFRNGVTATLSSVAEDIRAAIDECRQRLGVELNSVSQAVGGHIARMLAEAAEARIEATAVTASVDQAVDQIVARIDRALEDLVKPINGATTKIAKLIADANAKITDAAVKAQVDTALKAIEQAIVAARDKIAEARQLAEAVDKTSDQELDGIDDAIGEALAALSDIGADLTKHVDDINDLILYNVGAFTSGIADDLTVLIVEQIGGELSRITDFVEGPIKDIGTVIDSVVVPATSAIQLLRAKLLEDIRAIPAAVLPIIEDVRSALASAQHALSPQGLVDTLMTHKVIDPALTLLLQPLPGSIGDEEKALALARLLQFEEIVGGVIRGLTTAALDTMGELTAACSAVYEGVEEVAKYFKTIADEVAGGFAKYVETQLDAAYDSFIAALGPIPDAIKDIEKLLGALKSFDYSVRRLQNDLSRSFETAGAYADRVFDLAGKIDEGGLMAAPSNLLKLYSAVTTAPEIAALKADIDKLRAGFDELSDIIDTTKANALFNRLGDELRGLGLSLPFDKIGERLLPADLENFDIGKVFRNFGGAKLDRLFKGYKIPGGVKNAVKVTHDFDKKQARAWVQVDINAPFPGRRSLFSIGVFKADFVDMQLVGQVRLEASKDQDKVTQTGFGRIATKIDMVAGGQSMVTFNNFGLNFTKEKGLDIEFDPSNIRLNPQFQFIQDFLSTLFGGDPGGLQTVMEGGLPVGIEHLFIIPPITLNFGTSGVQNISIQNRFKLIAYPDFMIADRFNLSTIDQPFIFAIFIIGGTGYIQLEAQYRPFDSELTVLVEAGAGGSASLAFAFGPFSGQVFITLSGTLSYRKVIGKPGGGLSISVVLVIAGHVNVAGIVTVGITLMLRMTYRDSGQIDGDGSLTVTIRISKFFKLTARANIKYKLRGGKSETQVTTIGGNEELDKIQKAAKILEDVRN